jgi:hypothetical protein
MAHVVTTPMRNQAAARLFLPTAAREAVAVPFLWQYCCVSGTAAGSAGG